MKPSRNLFASCNLDEVRQSLTDQGFFLVENAYDEDFCRTAIEFIDGRQKDDCAEINYGGSEVRIWDSQEKHDGLGQFYEDCTYSLECLLNEKVKPKTLLAIGNRPIASPDSSLSMGRWHLDSFFNQVKIFLFLSETSEQSGPFEFIPGSHRNGFKFRMLAGGSYVKPSDLFTGKRAYQRIDDALVDRLSQNGHASRAVICKAGTIMVVNTSAIHRARPCLQGSRYALTAYYR